MEECVVARNKLAALQKKVAWYPGSVERHSAFKARFPDAEELGTDGAGSDAKKPAAYLPWLFKSGLTPEQVLPCS